MIKKMDFLYSDIRDNLIGKYLGQKENLNNNNIESYNDYITDEVLGEYAFKNKIEEFFNILAICVAMKKLNLYDSYFFQELQEMINEYEDGKYDNYLFDIKDKIDINKDVDYIKDAQ